MEIFAYLSRASHGFAIFHTHFLRVWQSTKFVHLFQVKFNISVENISFTVISLHQKYIDLYTELCLKIMCNPNALIYLNIIENGLCQPLFIFALSTENSEII